MSPLAGRKIALIGGAGFIGHNMALDLKARGCDVRIFDGLTVNNYYSLLQLRDRTLSGRFYLGVVRERLNLLEAGGVPLIEVDARDYHLLSRRLAEFRPDTIIHLAAIAHAGKSNKDPFSTFNHSLITLENCLDYARPKEMGVEHFIYFSSSMVYGHFAPGGVNEEMPCNPLGIYGGVKFAGEKLVVAYGQVCDLPYTIVRPSALYGPRCISRRVGQILIENALSGQDVVLQGDGADRLDFTYIDDLVAGTVCLLTSAASKQQIFNLTYGDSRSLAEMVELLRASFPEVQVQRQPKDKLMPDRGTLDVGKARRMIGYQPQFPLERGYPQYIAWYRANWDRILGLGDLELSRLGASPKTLRFARRDAWLSRTLGRECFTVTLDAALARSWRDGSVEGNELRDELANLRGFVSTKVGADDPLSLELAGALGFKLVTSQVLLEKTVPEPAARGRDPARIREARPEDRQAVAAVAAGAFEHSRFHVDPRIGKAPADAVKAAWAENFFAGQRGDAMAVAVLRGRVVGFLQLLRDAATGDTTIDLIAVAPAARRRGLGRDLIRFAERRWGRPGARFRVGTQLANVASLSLYEELGFRVARAEMIFHLHRETP